MRRVVALAIACALLGVPYPAGAHCPAEPVHTQQSANVGRPPLPPGHIEIVEADLACGHRVRLAVMALGVVTWTIRDAATGASWHAGTAVGADAVFTEPSPYDWLRIEFGGGPPAGAATWGYSLELVGQSDDIG